MQQAAAKHALFDACKPLYATYNPLTRGYRVNLHNTEANGLYNW